MTTKIVTYNRALRMIGLPPLSSVTAFTELRHLLDTEWDNEAVRYCLEQGLWGHARRVSKIDYTSDVEPSFGLNRAFTKPSDFVRLAAISADEFFTAPLTMFSDDPNYWYATIESIYVDYISDDSAYGGDLSIWPATFAWMVASYLGKSIGPIAQGADPKKAAKAEAKYEAYATDARSKAAMNSPIKFQPVGSWRRARRGGGRRAERGNTGSLTG